MNTPSSELSSRCQADRRGGAMLEFFGCAVALAGGLALGSLYFGVDVKKVAVTALEHAEMIATSNDSTAAPAAEKIDVAKTGSLVDSKADAESENAESKSVDAETAASDSSLRPSTAPPQALADALAIPIEQRRKLTRAYWDALDACMKKELVGRTAANVSESELESLDYLALKKQGLPKKFKNSSGHPLNTLNTQRSKNWALYEYLTLRNQGHQAAAEAIEQLDKRGVDGHVLAYAEKAQKWHREGAELFARAVDLLTDAPSAQLSGPFARTWQSKATQHQMEERLLAEKHQAVQSYLDHGAAGD